jgi:hypothetical protein
MGGHTCGYRYLEDAKRLDAELGSLRYWRMLPQEEKIAMLKDVSYQPPLHWAVGAARELGTDALHLLFGWEYLLPTAMEQSSVSSRDLKSAGNFVSVADRERWSWEQRCEVFGKVAMPMAERAEISTDSKPISQAEWQRAGKPYRQPSARPSATASGGYLCRSCGGLLLMPFCGYCKSQEVIPL